MGRESPAVPTRWLYTLLAIMFVLAMMSQVTFTTDAVRSWFRDYPLRPISLGAPWPTINGTSFDANQAGLRVGDRVISVEGREPKGLEDLAQAVRAKRTGDRLRIAVSRGGQPLEFAVKLTPVLPDKEQIAVTFILMPWLSLALGFWVAAVRPRDKIAWMMLGILVGLSEIERAPFLDSLGWPAAIGVPAAAFRQFASFAWGPSMLLFGFYFPKRGRLDIRVPWLKWLFAMPLFVSGIWEAIRTAGLALSFDGTLRTIPPNPIPEWLLRVLMYTSISLFFTAIGEKYGDPSLGKDHLRRLRLLYWGCTFSMTPSAVILLYYGVVHHSNPRGPMVIWSDMALILFPITLAYVIVVQRAMDVRMVIRQGVQYALARRGVRVLQAAMTITVVIGSAKLLESTKLSAPMRYTLIAIGILLVLRIRDGGEWLRRWVDRRFFREAYNAEQLLGQLGDQVHGILERDALLETVVRRISESLHVERIAVLLPSAGMFRPAFALGYPAAFAAEFAAGAAPVRKLSERREPMPADAAAKETMGAELLLPLASKKELLGFISLGPKRSEEPYSPSDTSLLRTVAAQTGLALENSRLSEEIAAEVAHREMLHREIEIAREVQQRLFPQNLPEVPALTYAGHCRPAQGVGGDYYDFLAISNGRLGLAIGDVSGKGIPAALLMASLQASVRGQSQSENGRVAALMTNVNRLVCDASPQNRYATFFYAQFDPATRRLVYTNGGHNPPILLRSGEVIRLEQGGPPVGLFRISSYVQDEIQLQPDDLLILFTDGISEAENAAEEEWGEDAIVEVGRACRELPPTEIITRLMEGADGFAAGAPQHDDMTLVVARVL